MKHTLLLLACFNNLSINLVAQNTSTNRPLPIIDVHVHAMKVGTMSVEMCPWFLRDMPGGDPNQPNQGMRAFLNAECVDPLQPAKSDAEMQAAVLATMERLNMTIVASGDAQILRAWKKAAPNRVIPSIGVSSPNEMSVKALVVA